MAANELLSATAIDLKTVRVLFANAGVPAYSTDLLVGNGEFSIAVIAGLPAFVPSIVSAEGYQSNGVGFLGVTLTYDQEFTPGTQYRVTVDNITGIPFNGSDNIADFLGKELEFPAERDFDLWNYIPAINKKEDTSGELADFIACIQEPLNFLVNDVDHWIDILDCNLAPENFVDLMLRDLGNPFVFSEPLTLVEKRRLAASLVELYKLKGTTLGVQTAIQFFMGMRSEIIRFDGLGNKLNSAAAAGPPPPKYNNKLSGQTVSGPFAIATPSFRLGSRRNWRFLVKAGTTVRSQTAAGQVSPQAGGPLTDKQKDQIARILTIMKPASMIQVQTGTPKQTGTEPSRRNAIRRNANYSIDLIMENIPNTSSALFLEADQPGVNEYNTTTTVPISGSSGDIRSSFNAIPVLQLEYDFDPASLVVADPGAGKVSLNHLSTSGATEISLSDTDVLAGVWTSLLDAFDSSIGSVTVYTRLRLKANAAKWAVYKITADTVGAGWRHFTVVYQARTLFTPDLAAGPRVYLETWVDGARYWNGIGQNLAHNTKGLLSNEITNALPKPTLLLTPGVGKITLSWDTGTDATAWRIYRSSSAALVTTDADNAATPIELSGDLSSYEDKMESGTTKFYIITPVLADSEGYMSEEVSATAL